MPVCLMPFKATIHDTNKTSFCKGFRTFLPLTLIHLGRIIKFHEYVFSFRESNTGKDNYDGRYEP